LCFSVYRYPGASSRPSPKERGSRGARATTPPQSRLTFYSCGAALSSHFCAGLALFRGTRAGRWPCAALCRHRVRLRSGQAMKACDDAHRRGQECPRYAACRPSARLWMGNPAGLRPPEAVENEVLRPAKKSAGSQDDNPGGVGFSRTTKTALWGTRGCVGPFGSRDSLRAGYEGVR
jgi:hypothetical protein